ncbi:MRC [Mytilus coruscus]|uniref:MRC n=1 Tax=Mytilus coruscus TaxID=42192 RepID=A0A6J8DUL8_MYTCO|nr:MRC [Mytilus coruscus]
MSPNIHTYDVYSESIIKCAKLCSEQDLCCVASFAELTSICRIDKSENCSLATFSDTGWNIMRKQLYIPPSCTECFSYASSTYKVIEDTLNWEMARDNCYDLGGKLVEMETQDENDFIKSTLTVRNANITGNKIYYLGGFKFKPDEDIRWVSTPSQEMAFVDMAPGEPNNPNSELCLGAINYYDFQWIDLPCAWLNPYICEFF